MDSISTLRIDAVRLSSHVASNIVFVLSLQEFRFPHLLLKKIILVQNANVKFIFMTDLRAKDREGRRKDREGYARPCLGK